MTRRCREGETLIVWHRHGAWPNARRVRGSSMDCRHCESVRRALVAEASRMRADLDPYLAAVDTAARELAAVTRTPRDLAHAARDARRAVEAACAMTPDCAAPAVYAVQTEHADEPYPMCVEHTADMRACDPLGYIEAVRSLPRNVDRDTSDSRATTEPSR